MKLEIRLHEILQEHGMTQKELSQKTSIRPNAISEMCHNSRSCINKSHVERIAKALNVTKADELFVFR